MKQVLVTGASGFVGRNLCSVLKNREDICLHEFDIEDSLEALETAIERADFIFHLAGVNRPKTPEEFETGNADFTDDLCHKIKSLNRSSKIVFSSSIQADGDTLYGQSKRRAEQILMKFAEETDVCIVVYRLKNLFGKWCRPNYNSVTATFCHNIANNLPIAISDRHRGVDLSHIDDVVAVFLNELENNDSGFRFADPLPSTHITLGELADKIYFFKRMRDSLMIPDFQSVFERALYGTYLSYLDKEDFDYELKIRSDPRGSLAEFIKSPSMGQIFVSQTKPGVTRGDHYHHTKAEKFLVVQGTAFIRFRQIGNDQILEYRVRGEEYRVLDIPPGYTHSIENVGQDDLVTLFWASEVFDPKKPDTFYEKV